MDLLRPGYERVKDIADEDERVRALEKQAILISMENLMTFPFVKDAVEANKLSLHGLWNDIGDVGAEEVVCRAMEELAVRLSLIERLYRQDRHGEMRKSARSLTGIAEQIGMNTLSRVAGDVIICIDTCDEVAMAATLSRLLRIGEQSLTEIWDMQGVEV